MINNIRTYVALLFLVVLCLNMAEIISDSVSGGIAIIGLIAWFVYGKETKNEVGSDEK